MKTFSSIWWVVKLQFQASKGAALWNLIYHIYDGLSSLAYVYVVAKLITAATAVALQQADTRTFYVWLAAIFGLEIIRVVLRSFDWLVDRKASDKLKLYTSELFFNKVYELSQEQFDNQEFNTKLDRAQAGLRQFGRVSRELTRSISSFVQFIGSITAIVVVAPVVGAVIIISTIPAIVLRLRQNKLREKSYVEAEPTDRVASRSYWMLVDPNTMPEIRIVNGFKKLFSSWRNSTKKTQSIYYKSDRNLLRYELGSDLVEPAIGFFATIYFFRLLAAGSIALDRFIFLRGILEQASSSALSLATSFDTLHELSINIQNVREVLDTAPAIPKGSVVVTAPLTIEFKNVDFAYPETEAKSLEDVSFIIVPGSKLALVGENGAGKTTLIKLLLRQYLPAKGQITVNGTDIIDVEQESYYRALSILSQDFVVASHLTIKDNLTIGLNRRVSTDEIKESTDMVDATDFITKLPHEYDQRLDSSYSDGSNVSGGQLQRIGISRALLRNSDVMILDEPTSAIDAKAEFSIFNNIYKKHEGRTTLIVSHRFSTVRKADQIIVMASGKITEYGSHEELMKYKGLYRQMFDLQAEGYK